MFYSVILGLTQFEAYKANFKFLGLFPIVVGLTLLMIKAFFSILCSLFDSKRGNFTVLGGAHQITYKVFVVQ